MPRNPRRAPKREKDPLDVYSTWNIRIARTFFISFIVISLVIVVGIWATIIGALMETGKMDLFLSLDLAWQVFIITGAVCGHLFLLVFFYILFKGGKLRLLKVLFKDRLVAKKFEDFQTLRLLIGVTLLSVYIMLVSFFIGVLPLAVFEAFSEFWNSVLQNLNAGGWILYVSLYALAIILILFFMFVLWNHGVYYVLRKVKRIEEEDEVKGRIKKEELQQADSETLKDEYRKETGKNPIYRGKETKGFTAWKKDKLE